MCDCITRVNANETLIANNTKISEAINIGGKSLPPQILTTKIDKKKCGKPKTLFAAFCPFCGVAFGTPAADTKETP